ncbi:MAG: hypothetical protein IJZ37_00135, partial [Clostridia bacterium]|nr:hypothetical protein [Clostridia bacterium]
WDHVAVGDTRTSGRNDDVDVEASGSDTFGSDWESLGYSSFEELKEAVESCAVVMDENSDRIAFEQNQQRTDTLTNRDLLLKEKLGRIEIEEGKAVFEEESATELSAWR